MTLLLRLKASNVGPVGGGPDELASLGPLLEKLRDEICDIDEKMLSGDIPIPVSKQPLGTGFVSLPARMLADYEATRPASELGRMLAVTKQLMTEVDRVVVLGEGEHLSGPQAVMHGCCQPYFNQLSRGERGSRPRMVFVGPSLDNDEVQGVLHLLGDQRGRAATTLQERWGLVVIGQEASSQALNCLLQPLLAALLVNTGGDPQVARSRTLLVTSQHEPLSAVASELGDANCFYFAEGVVPRFSVLSMPGLLTAALLGINIMQLLEGARQTSLHFRTAKAADNLVLQLAGRNHLMEGRSAGLPRSWSAWSQALSGTSCWYQQLLRRSIGKQLLIEDPLAIERRHTGITSPEQTLLTQVVTDRFRFDPLPIVGATLGLETEQDPPLAHENTTTESNLADVLQSIYQRTQHSLQLSQWPTLELALPQVDEPSLGQLLQLLMLATVVEGRLMGRNPFT